MNVKIRVGMLRRQKNKTNHEHPKIEISRNKGHVDIRSCRVERGALRYIDNTKYQLIWSNGGPNQKHFISKTFLESHFGCEILSSYKILHPGGEGP